MDHRNVVGREMHVELEAVGARRDPEIEACQRVLGTQGAAAAMREDERRVRSFSGRSVWCHARR